MSLTHGETGVSKSVILELFYFSALCLSRIPQNGEKSILQSSEEDIDNHNTIIKITVIIIIFMLGIV